ncbi:MAG: V4R domain-containing protein [Candidatus Jordarchaeaceae archaeon]
MNFVTSGNSELDVLLGGGFVRNSSTLFLTEAGSMGELVALNLFTNRLLMGDTGFIIDLDIPPKRIRDWFKFRNFNIDGFERNERFFLVDGFTKMYGAQVSDEKYVIDKPRDIIHVNAYIVELAQIIEKYKPNVFSLVFSSNLFLFRRQDPSKVINLIYKARVMLSQFGLCIFVFDKGMMDEKSLRTLEHAFDYVLHLKTSERDRRFQKYLRVIKSPSPTYRDDSIPYEIRHGSFALSTETVEEFDYMKQQMKMLDDGVLKLLDSRVTIHDPHFSSLLFEIIMSEFGYEEACTFMYQQGKKMPPLLVEAFRQQFKIDNLKRMVESFAKFAELRGYGTFKVEFDEETNVYKLKTFNSPFCSYFKGLGKNVGFLAAGLIAACFETYTGDKYECEETKCVAKGDDFCEYIVKPSKI